MDLVYVIWRIIGVMRKGYWDIERDDLFVHYIKKEEHKLTADHEGLLILDVLQDYTIEKILEMK